jgi:hypothetical protein
MAWFARKLTFAMQQQHVIRRFSPILLNCRHLAKLQTPSGSLTLHNTVCGRREASGAYYRLQHAEAAVRSTGPAPGLPTSAGDGRGRRTDVLILTGLVYLTHQPQKDLPVLVVRTRTALTSKANSALSRCWHARNCNRLQHHKNGALELYHHPMATVSVFPPFLLFYSILFYYYHNNKPDQQKRTSLLSDRRGI